MHDVAQRACAQWRSHKRKKQKKTNKQTKSHDVAQRACAQWRSHKRIKTKDKVYVCVTAVYLCVLVCRCRCMCAGLSELVDLTVRDKRNYCSKFTTKLRSSYFSCSSGLTALAHKIADMCNLCLLLHTHQSRRAHNAIDEWSSNGWTRVPWVRKL